MPFYEYQCPEHGRFDKLEPVRPWGVDSNHCFRDCPECGGLSGGTVSLTNHTWKNIVRSGTQGGEGFTSVMTPVREADERAKYGLHKGDKL